MKQQSLPPKARISGDLARYWPLYLLLAPAAVYTLIFNYGPLYGVIIAFKNFNPVQGILGSPWAGLEHFIRFVNFPNFPKLLRNTMGISLYALATFPVSLLFALSLNEMRNAKYKKFVQLATYMPNFISVVILCGMVLLFFNRSMGLVNNVLETMGFQRVDFLAGPGYFPHLYVWSGVWQQFGWGSIIYLAALSNVSGELIEAARMDGASRLQIIWHVHLPDIVPIVILLLILSCGGILSTDFQKILLLQNDLNREASEVISSYVYEIGLVTHQYSYSAAIGLFNTVVNVLILLLVNAVAKKTTSVGIW
jgi:putative aldouronate transport system permease protein